MSTAPRTDPLTLDPDGIAYHQLATFFQRPLSLAKALVGSHLFEVEIFDNGALADWVQYSLDEERSFFPLGRVCLHEQGILLEAFSEDRMRILVERVNTLGSWQITSDQTRALQIHDAIERPSALLQPIHELRGIALGSREVAETYLRMAWPFLVREDLGGRAPHALIQTGRGRAALGTILEGLPDELAREVRSFPTFEVEELRRILVPAESEPEIPEEKTHPADDRQRP